MRLARVSPVRARIGTVVLGALLMSAPIWSQSMMSTSGKLVPYKDADKILSYDAGAKTVSVNLEGSQGSAAYGMNFNNFAKGTMVIRVPVGWTVTVSLLVDSRLKHSAMVVPWSQREGEDFTPAFQGSEPKEYAVGIGKGQPKEEFTFKADRTGQYAVVCGVPGHAEAGMWDEFDVVAGTSAPEVLVKG